jgi:predicted regulator of Ras-like GTPase activity (Roadblock/LC7/MglB family)
MELEAGGVEVGVVDGVCEDGLLAAGVLCEELDADVVNAATVFGVAKRVWVAAFSPQAM